MPKDTINTALTALNRTTGKSFTLDSAYGGWKVWDDAAGRDPIETGFVSKSQLVKAIWVFIAGYRFALGQK